MNVTGIISECMSGIMYEWTKSCELYINIDRGGSALL